ncbi:C-type lectin domain family 2 member H-like [Alexandromys fortis]|uniref:C-type lectin domain family 2 member H-like n=1 Tax=Alexandromys fortis TaxID=100897 RepID=UPI0021530348|nr:C-type lectin domain family 2 member H-like [Microtus fortis]
MDNLKSDFTTSHCLQVVEIGEKLQGKCLRNVCPARLSCYCVIIFFFTVATIAVCATLLLRVRSGIEYHRPCYATCPREWIGFGSKCFYFSEDIRNWTSSQTSCMALEAHLAKFESLEELNFMKRYKGPSDHWIGLHRKSAHHPWKWTDNTEYNSSVLTRGEGECAYLSDSGISSARDYTPKKWICSKSNRYT